MVLHAQVRVEPALWDNSFSVVICLAPSRCLDDARVCEPVPLNSALRVAVDYVVLRTAIAVDVIGSQVFLDSGPVTERDDVLKRIRFCWRYERRAPYAMDLERITF